MIPFNFQKSDPPDLYWIGGQYTIGHGPDGWRIFSPLAQNNCQGRSTYPKMYKQLLNGTYGIREFHLKSSQLIVALKKTKVPSNGEDG